MNKTTKPGRPPLHARLHWYRLTSDELALLLAMVEQCSDGSVIRAALPRLVAFSKLPKRTIQALIDGYVDKREGRSGVIGLVERGVLTRMAPSSWRKHQPASYRLNEEALDIDPQMAAVQRRRHRLFVMIDGKWFLIDEQMTLPGIPWRPESDRRENGETPSQTEVFPEISPVMATEQVQRLHQAGAAAALGAGAAAALAPPEQVRRLHQAGAAAAPDSTSIDPNTNFDPKSLNDPKTEIHHASGAINPIPKWIALKEQLRDELPAEEWDLWVKPARLLRMMGGSEGQLLVALPRNGRILEAARKRKQFLSAAAQRFGFAGASQTTYPDQWQLDEGHKRGYGDLQQFGLNGDES